jgi:hypothetical protein
MLSALAGDQAGRCRAMQESMGRIEIELISTNGIALAREDTLELGSFVAALCEETEDEFELDLRIRAFLESAWLRRAAGFASVPEAAFLGN